MTLLAYSQPRRVNSGSQNELRADPSEREEVFVVVKDHDEGAVGSGEEKIGDNQ